MAREPIESATGGRHRRIRGSARYFHRRHDLRRPASVQPLPFVKINDPTVEMTFSVNDSPFAGKEGKYVTSRQIRDRLMRELLKDVVPAGRGFRARPIPSASCGRGEMHLSILIETMRREGYEFQVSPPHVLTHEDRTARSCEPMERVVVDVPETYRGQRHDRTWARARPILMNMQTMNSRSRIEFRMPSRGLFGYRSRVPDRHPRRGHHEHDLRRLRANGAATSRPAPPAPSSALIPATPSPTACSTPSSAAP